MKKLSILVFVILMIFLQSCNADNNEVAITLDENDTAVISGTSDEFTLLKLGDEEGEELSLKDNTYGVCFACDGKLVGVTVSPAINGEETVFADVNIYKWNVDYDTTVSASAVQSGTMMFSPDEGAAGFSFSNTIALDAGRYLITFSSEEEAYIYSSKAVDGVECYKNGEKTENGLFVSIMVKN